VYQEWKQRKRVAVKKISESKTQKVDHDDHKQELCLSLEKLNLAPKKKKLLVMNLNGFLLHRAYLLAKNGIPKS